MQVLPAHGDAGEVEQARTQAAVQNRAARKRGADAGKSVARAERNSPAEFKLVQRCLHGRVSRPPASDTARLVKDELDALVLFRGDIAACVPLYGFLSQMLDYGNVDTKKRAIFFLLLHLLSPPDAS